jgi:hypothetical protein
VGGVTRPAQPTAAPRAAHDVVDPDSGRVRVLSRQCETCIFWPGDRMGLGPDRIAEVISLNLAAGSLLTCHSTLPYGENRDFGPAVCAGYWARHARAVLAGRYALAFMGVVRVEPPNARDKSPRQRH